MTNPSSETEALRAVTREAHEAIKDLTRLLRDCREAKAQIEDVAAQVFDRMMSDQVEKGLAIYYEAIDKAITDATLSVEERFDGLADALLGASRRAKRRGVLDLEAVAKPRIEHRIDPGVGP